MALKSSSPGPNPPPSQPSKPTRTRKATTRNQASNIDTSQANPASEAAMESQKIAKTKSAPSATKPLPKASETSTNQTKKKPRKLNKDPISKTRVDKQPAIDPISSKPSDDGAAATELEALKSRVRGLEAKVEELYKSSPTDRPGRSPRRRGKGRKASSTQQVPTLATMKSDPKIEQVQDSTVEETAEAEEADEELVRLEDELEVARQDLAHYRPRTRRSRSNQTTQSHVENEDDVEDIPRGAPGVESAGTTRQVTLSGSYRIPLPASVNTEDLKTIQSGVSAAQNVARSFLEQRRAAASLREQQQQQQQQHQQQTSSSTAPKSTSAQAKRPRPPPKSVSSTMEVVKVDDGNKQSWSEWFGGYSVAISRAVKNIEHEAAVESQGTAGNGGRRGSGAAGGAKSKAAGKRPAMRTKASGE